MQETPKKRCIIFSYGPVPTPEHDKVEGGGLRCWGLAKGLHAQGEELDVTVAYHESYRKGGFVSEYESINITTWNESTIEELLQGFDTVVVSYCMGELSVTIANTILPNQQLVLDCYVPIYVEISARSSEDVEGEYRAFENEVSRWAAVLRRGDLYLCANDNQKRYYQGVLSGLGRINPVTYQDDLILLVPYGVYREKPVVKSKPISEALKLQKSEDYKKILWFGAVYPWFDLRTLVDAIKKINKTLPAKLIIVGAKNPFNAHPDFIQRYEELIAYINSSASNKENIILQDWVEFDDRADWYLDSDLVILINKIGNENELAWRTRLVDYIWADLPILTNGGDPLGEELIKAKAAARLNDLSSDGIAEDMKKLLVSPKNLVELKQNIGIVRKKYYWDTVTDILYEKIVNHTRPTDFIKFGLLDVDAAGVIEKSVGGRIVRKARQIPSYYSKYGARNTYTALKTVGVRRLRGTGQRTEPRVIFVAHQLDTTGAPHVFIDMLKDFRQAYPRQPIEFHMFNPAAAANISALNKIGIKPKLHISRDIKLPYVKGDIVVLNTVAFSDTMRNAIYEDLEKGIIKKLIWYVHEDEPDYIFSKYETKQIKKLMKSHKIVFFTAAEKTKDNYIKHFGAPDQIKTQIYRVEVPKRYHKIRVDADFDKLDFILPGMVGDGRKGQLPILYAFIEFKQRYFDASPKDYRDFSLTYIGLGKDFLSRQLLKHTSAGLGDKFKYFGPVSHETCFKHVINSNITVCYSMRECLPMFVYEGMVAGHPLLRNDSSGLEEQLIDNENGFYLDSKDLEQVIQTIEKICNKTKTSNKILSGMSKASYDIATQLEDTKYDTISRYIDVAFKEEA